MSFKLNPSKFLDKKLCYELWAKKRISIYKIPIVLANEYNIRAASGNLVTSQGVWRAAWLYALENMDEAEKDTIAIMSQLGMVYDRNDFLRDCFNKAKQFYSAKNFRKFMAIHPEFRQFAS